MIDLSTGLRLSQSQALADVFAGGSIRLFSGTKSDAAEDAETDLLLGIVTINADGTGLVLVASDAYVYNPPGARWAFTGLANGSAGYFRLVAPGDTGTASATEPRVAGTIGVFGSGSDMEWTTTAVIDGITYALDSFIYIVHPIARTAP